MIPIQPSLKHTLLKRASFIIDALQKSITDLHNFKDTEDEVILSSSIFPLGDFQPDKSGAPDYIPQDSTLLSLTPLHIAAYYGKDNIIERLLVFSEVNADTKYDMATPLFLSLINGRLSTAKLLLGCGASPDGESCATGLHAAARQGLLAEICNFVQNYHVEPDIEDSYGATPVVYALYLPEEEALKTISLLFDLGARADAVVGNYVWAYADLARVMGKEELAFWLE
ncbi:ankyrin repeat-containing domain protein, partial [Dactylonectria macrodidyma]